LVRVINGTTRTERRNASLVEVCAYGSKNRGRIRGNKAAIVKGSKDKMNDDDWENKTILHGGGEWLKEKDGLYTKYMNIHYKDGRVDRHIMESGVTEKEYFKKKLDGSD